MPEEELAARVADVLSVDPDDFRERAEADAEVIKDAVEEGVFDNPQAIVGLEYEFYAVKADDCTLRRVPRRLLELIGFEKELGLHNAEMTTSPQPLNAHGLTAQESEVKSRLRTALNVTQSERMRLVSDALWTIPPEGEAASTYLTDSVERTATAPDGTERTVRIATNMSDSARYHARWPTRPRLTPRGCVSTRHTSRCRTIPSCPRASSRRSSPITRFHTLPTSPSTSTTPPPSRGPAARTRRQLPIFPPICTMRTRPPTKSFETAGWNTASASSRPSSMTRPRGRKGPLPARPRGRRRSDRPDRHRRYDRPHAGRVG